MQSGRFAGVRGFTGYRHGGWGGRRSVGGYGYGGYDDYGPGIIGGLIAGSLVGAGLGYGGCNDGYYAYSGCTYGY
jgi:hypothetical protein